MKYFISLSFFIFSIACSLSSQTLVADINKFEKGSFPKFISGNNDTLVFAAQTDGYDYKLFYKIGDTPEKLLIDGNENETFLDVQMLNGHVYAATVTYSNGANISFYKIDFKNNKVKLLGISAQFANNKNGNFIKSGSNVLFVAQNAQSSLDLYKVVGDEAKLIENFPISFNNSPLIENTDSYLSFYQNFIVKIDDKSSEVLKSYPMNSQIVGFFPLDKGFIFIGYTFNSKPEFYYFDGNNEPKLFLQNSSAQGFTWHNNRLYYLVNEFGNGVGLYYLDNNFENATKEADLDYSIIESGKNLLSTKNGLYLEAYLKNTYEPTLYKYEETNKKIIYVSSIKDGITPIGSPISHLIYKNTSTGKELYKFSEGSDNPILVKDINIGKGSSNIESIFQLNDKIYYAADNLINGSELWSTNLKTHETNLVANISLEQASSFPYNFKVIDNEKLFFSAKDGEKFETHIYSKKQNKITKPLSKENYGDPFDFFHVNNNVIYTATDSNNVRSHFTLNLSTNETKRLINNPEVRHSGGGSAAVINNKYLFHAFDPLNGGELWVSEGTQESTKLLKNISSTGQSFPTLTNTKIGSSILFGATYNDQGEQLWKSDGTPEGTLFVKDIDPSIVPPNFISPILSSFTQLSNDKVLFIGMNNLWITNGLESGTISLSSSITNVQSIHALNNLGYIIANDINGISLYTTDGTVENTRAVLQIKPNTYNNILGNDGSNIYYATYENEKVKLYKFDGTTNTLLLDEEESGVRYPNSFVNFENKMFFTATDLQHGKEIWVTDGTKSGTKLLFDINPGPRSMSQNQGLIKFEGELYFSADNGKNGEELWKLSTNSTVKIDKNKGSSMLIYPNPTSGSLNLTFTQNDTEAYKACIYDNVGRLIKCIENQSTISIDELNNGLYHLYLDKGNIHTRYKIILAK